MPFAPHPEVQPAESARSMLSTLRRSRNDATEMQERPQAGGLASNGLKEDGRTHASAGGMPTTVAPTGRRAPEPLVLDPGTVLVVYDGGAAGRAALAHAVRALPGSLAIVCFWQAGDPLAAARAAELPGSGAALLHDLHAGNERARADAERSAADAVAIAQEAGREAVGLVRREPEGVARDALVRELVDGQAADHVVLSAAPRSWWRRALLGRGPCERLAADPPCAVTVVPAPRA